VESSPQKLLEALVAGQPINGSEGYIILNSRFTDAISSASAAVSKARGLKPSRVKEVHWLTGRPGNGKTQSLRQFTYQLPRIEGAGKYAYAHVDFDKEPAARQPEALIPAIVRHCLAAGVVKEIEEVCDRVIRQKAADDRIKGSAAFGIDVASSLAGVPAPSLFVDPAYKHISAWFRRRDAYIRKKVAEQWPENPHLVEFMTAWVRYILEPVHRRGEEFASVLTRLTTQGDLFDLFCFALQSADYGTLVLVFDEVDRVALTSLKPLWDPPEPGSPFYHELNMVLIIAAKEGVWVQANANEALARRFCRTVDGYYDLSGPQVDVSGNDDFEHVVSTVDQLLREAPYLRKKGVDREGPEIRELRATISRENRLSSRRCCFRAVF
jgi:hypothetical protein